MIAHFLARCWAGERGEFERENFLESSGFEAEDPRKGNGTGAGIKGNLGSELPKGFANADNSFRGGLQREVGHCQSGVKGRRFRRFRGRGS